MPRPRTFDEAAVVAAARDEFWARGYAATSVDDLTAVTGLGKGSLYGAFGDKRGLFVRALDEFIGAALADIRAQLRNHRHNPYDRLTRHIRNQTKAVCADVDRRGCMMAKSAAELGATDTAVAQAVERAYAAWLADLADCINQAQRAGTIARHVDAHTLATTLLGFLRGLQVLHHGGVKPAQLKAAAEQVIALIPRG